MTASALYWVGTAVLGICGVAIIAVLVSLERVIRDVDKLRDELRRL